MSHEATLAAAAEAAQTALETEQIRVRQLAQATRRRAALERQRAPYAERLAAGHIATIPENQADAALAAEIERLDAEIAELEA